MAQGIDIKDGKVRVACPGCGRWNAIPVARLNQGPVCGACGADMAVGGRVVDLSDQNFYQVINSAPMDVLVDFWSPGCGPCMMMAPQLERFAASRSDRVLVAKVDASRNPQIASHFGIQAVPTLLVFRGGREIRRQAGLVPEQSLGTLLAA